MPSVASFLAERLATAGVGHAFGRAGDTNADFVAALQDADKIRFVENSDEAHAGFAADAYARVRGAGCVTAAYNCGVLKLCNAAAGAYAERSPLVIVAGSPALKDRNDDFLRNRVIRGFDTQYQVFRHLTCYSAVLDDPTRAGFQIDEAIEALKYHKQPVFLEIPRDVAASALRYDVYRQGTPVGHDSDPETLKDAVKEVAEWLCAAERPVIVAGVQITRCGLGGKLVRFAERYNIPLVTTLLSKSTVNEAHPMFHGVYGVGGQVRNLVENSDCLLVLGEIPTETPLGSRSRKFQKRQAAFCSFEGVRVKNHTYDNVLFQDFCLALFDAEVTAKAAAHSEEAPAPRFAPEANRPVTGRRLFEKLNSCLMDKSVVVADASVLKDAADLEVRHHGFYGPAVYGCPGTAVPGVLGVGLAAADSRPVALLDRHSFEATVAELRTAADCKLNATVFVLADRCVKPLAEAFGLRAVSVGNEQELAEISLKGDGVCVVSTLIGA